MNAEAPKRRRLRATFLLKSVVLVACLAVIAIGIAIGTWWAIVGALVFAGLIYVTQELGLDGLLFPNVAEWLVVRRAERSGKPVSSIWFVDRDREEVEMALEVLDDSGDNPTIR